jgi:hypothetical protein
MQGTLKHGIHDTRPGGNMTNQDDPAQPQSMQINTTDDLSRGRYSNFMLVSHSPEEFMIDWILNSPNGPHLVSRIILSPRSVMRTIEALTSSM